MNKIDLDEILRLHKLWLTGDSEGKKANLSWADLRGADLRGANLRGANLRWANIKSANLSEADLRGADLSEAALRGADLSEADLRGADLRGADLRWVMLPLGFYYVNLGRHNVYAYGGYIRIGCKYFTAKAWLDKYKKIGNQNGYTNEQIKDYGDFIKWYNRKIDKLK